MKPLRSRHLWTGSGQWVFRGVCSALLENWNSWLFFLECLHLTKLVVFSLIRKYIYTSTHIDAHWLVPVGGSISAWSCICVFHWFCDGGTCETLRSGPCDSFCFSTRVLEEMSFSSVHCLNIVTLWTACLELWQGHRHTYTHTFQGKNVCCDNMLMIRLPAFLHVCLRNPMGHIW